MAGDLADLVLLLVVVQLGRILVKDVASDKRFIVLVLLNCQDVAIVVRKCRENERLHVLAGMQVRQLVVQPLLHSLDVFVQLEFLVVVVLAHICDFDQLLEEKLVLRRI